MQDWFINPQAQISTAGLVASPTGWRGWFMAALDWLYPPRCASCGRVDHRWCDDCLRTLQAEPLHPQTATIDGVLTVNTTAAHAGLPRAAIHAFKYEGAPELYAPLGERLAIALNAWAIQPDCIVPVPLHIERQRQRMYNQAALLAWELSRRSGLPLRMDWLTRQRDTRAQVGLDHDQRRDNVAGAFTASTEAAGKHVLIVDDVFTTGATLAACADALRIAGATAINGITVTRALKPGADERTNSFID